MEPVNSEGRRPARFSIPLPGMRAGQSVGLGSVLKRMTSSVGIRPCVGCESRAGRLDRTIWFMGRNQEGNATSVKSVRADSAIPVNHSTLPAVTFRVPVGGWVVEAEQKYRSEHSNGSVKGVHGDGESSPCICKEGDGAGWESIWVYRVESKPELDPLPANTFLRLDLEFDYWIYYLSGEIKYYEMFFDESWRIKAGGLTLPDPHWVHAEGSCAIWCTEIIKLSLEIVEGAADDEDFIMWQKKVDTVDKDGYRKQVSIIQPQEGREGISSEKFGNPTKTYTDTYFPYHCYSLAVYGVAWDTPDAPPGTWGPVIPPWDTNFRPKDIRWLPDTVGLHDGAVALRIDDPVRGSGGPGHPQVIRKEMA